MNTFDKIADKYKERALVQQKAALKLINLLNIGRNEDVIDIACGPGHITNQLSKITKGRVIGIDISEGMIKQAKAAYPDIEFRDIAAEDLDYSNEFDVAFCNSSLIWFRDPDKAIKTVFNSLKKSGRLGLACSATPDWAPWLDRIISGVVDHRDIKPVFSHWKNPWFYLPEKNDYRLFFERHGFKTEVIELDYEQAGYSADEAFDVYLSGAANGYTGKGYYDIEINDDYITAFNNSVRDEITRQSKNGRINIDFNRLYYIGKK